LIDVLNVSSAQFDVALDVCEERLRELGAALDKPVQNDFLQRAMIALSTRARSYFIGFLELIQSTHAPAAAFVLLRPAVEVNLFLRFLADRPDVHLDLWEAEGDLEMLKWVDEIEGDPQLMSLMRWPKMTDQWRAGLGRRIAAARTLGAKEGMRGVSTKPRGRLMPSTRDLAWTHGDLSTRHAYSAAYRPLSLFTHPSARGFTFGQFVSAGDDLIRFEELTDPEDRLRTHRALNGATYASTLTVASEPLGLDILEDAARVRDALVNLNLVG